MIHHTQSLGNGHQSIFHTGLNIPIIIYDYLVAGLEHEFYVSIQLGTIIPFDELIFFRGVGIPPTRPFLIGKSWQINYKSTINQLSIGSACNTCKPLLFSVALRGSKIMQHHVNNPK